MARLLLLSSAAHGGRLLLLSSAAHGVAGLCGQRAP
jgi:hypothetical protein